MTHWASKYIGDAWIAGEHDCWAFFRRVQREQFAREIPVIDVDANDRLACARAAANASERDRWADTDTPAEGDAVLMAHSRAPSHVGIWTEANGGAVLHCAQGAGVLCQSIRALKMAGWGHIRFYRFKGAS